MFCKQKNNVFDFHIIINTKRNQYNTSISKKCNFQKFLKLYYSNKFQIPILYLGKNSAQNKHSLIEIIQRIYAITKNTMVSYCCVLFLLLAISHIEDKNLKQTLYIYYIYYFESIQIMILIQVASLYSFISFRIFIIE